MRLALKLCLVLIASFSLNAKENKSSFSGKWLAFSTGIGSYTTKHTIYAKDSERIRLNNYSSLTKLADNENNLDTVRYLGSGYFNPRVGFEWKRLYGEVITGFSLNVNTTLFNRIHKDSPFYYVGNQLNDKDENTGAPRIDEKHGITPSYCLKKNLGIALDWCFGIDLKAIGASNSLVWATCGFELEHWKVNTVYENLLDQSFAAAGEQDLPSAADEYDVTKVFQILSKIKEEQKVKNNDLIVSWGIGGGIDVMLNSKSCLFVSVHWHKAINSINQSFQVSHEDVEKGKSYTIAKNNYNPMHIDVTCGVKFRL